MKIKGEDRQIISNVDNSHKFTIDNNAKMFEILSSRIYTYKPAAIVREISWNAYDSHIEAGKADVPFRVVLPNEMYPYFEVEDYGVGLDEDGVKNIYTQYGNSTKGDSNEVVGAFGLGSKTPFAYTKSFIIQTRKDGIEYLFNAYIGNGGEPTISLTRTRDTQECNGVKIKIPVKTDEFRSFYNEAEFILSFFPVRPEVVTGEIFNFDFEKSDVMQISKDKVTCLNNKSVRSALYMNHKYFAVMGGVCYPVKWNDIRIHDNNHNYLNKVIMRSNDVSMFIKFDIGEIDVNASREGLSIEEGSHTEKVLTERFNQAIEYAKLEDQKEIDQCTHPVEAIKLIDDKYGPIIMLVGGQFNYKGKPLTYWAGRRIKPSIIKGYAGAMIKTNGRFDKKSAMRVNELQQSDMLNRRFIVVYPESEKTTSLEAKIKRWCKRYESINILYFKKPVSQKSLNKLYAMYHISPFKQFTFEEILKIERKERKANQLAIVAGSNAQNLPKKKNTEISARGFVTWSDNGQYFKNRRVDISDDEYEYYWMNNESMNSNKSLIIIDNDDRPNTMITCSVLGIIKKISGRSVKILFKNAINKKSIEENDIPYVKEFFDDIKDNYVEEIKNAYIAGHIFTVNVKTGKICLQGRYSIIEAMYMANSPLLYKEFIDFYTHAKQNESKYVDYYQSNVDQRFASYVLKDEFSKTKDFLDNILIAKNKTNERYPMLRYCTLSQMRWSQHDEDMIKHIADYMSSIEFIEQQNKLATNAA